MRRLACLSLAACSIIAVTSSVSCKKKGIDGGAPITPVVEEKTAICLYDGLAVRATATKGGKFLSSLSLGETVRYTGDTDKDESGREYMKVELSDGKTGWALSLGLVPKAQIGAMKDDTIIYRRPDLVTATTQKIPFMTIVAVTQQKDTWLEVIGEGKRNLGWVRKDAVAQEKEDVTVAILASKKLKEKDNLDPAKKLEAIIGASPNPNSYFIQKLKERTASAAPVVPPAPDAGNPGGEGGAEGQ
jgi:hypothetical protein